MDPPGVLVEGSAWGDSTALPFPMFWGWSGIPQGGKIDFGPANMRLWRWYKAQGAPRDPEYVRPLEAFALYLLQEGVNA
jgi:hypothetical protein